MRTVDEYVKLTKEEKQAHLKLSEPCDERGGNSVTFKGILAYFLDTEIPSGYRLLLCHACFNPKCSKPSHLYWGTPSENINDQVKNGTFKTIWERTVEKYGYDEACKMNGRGDKSAGGKANKDKPKSKEHKRKISDAIKKWSSGETGSTRGS
jgi:hypothetical protein